MRSSGSEAAGRVASMIRMLSSGADTRIAARAADYGEDVLMRMRLSEKVTGVRYAQSLSTGQRGFRSVHKFYL